MPRFVPSALVGLSVLASSTAFHQAPLGSASRRVSNVGFDQAGSSIFGTPRFNATKANNFGAAVSLTPDGLRLAVGATDHDASAASEGNGGIFLYDYVNSDWTPSAVSIIGTTGEGIGDRFSISDDASRIAIRRRPNGAPDNVEVYQAGSRIGSPISNCAAAGNTVSISPDGSRVAVSCERNDSNAGLVEIFEWNNGLANWDLMDTLDGAVYADLTDNLFGFATSFDASGNRLAISAIFQNAQGPPAINRAGSTFVFEYNAGTTSWEPMGSPVFGVSATSRFGASLDLNADGTVLAVGAPTSGTSGEVYLYELDGSNQWVPKGALVAGETTGDQFGRSVALSSDGSRFAASSGLHNGSRGQVRLFQFIGNAWVPVEGDIEGLDAGDQFGIGITSVGLSGNGVRVASAGVGASNDNGLVTGRARVFDRSLDVVDTTPSSVPSVSPSASSAPSASPVTPIPTSALGKFDWDLERTGNVTATFDEASEQEEIELAYSIHLRTAVVSILDINCENPVASNLVSVAHSTTPVSGTHGELDVVLDIKQDSVVGSPIWTDGATTGSGSIDVCVRVDLVLDDGLATSVNFHEQKLYLSINLSQGFTVATIDLDRENADLDNQEVQVEYGLESCQCNSTFDCVNDVLVQGDDVYICVYSTDTNIEISTIEELDFTQTGVGGIAINAIDNTIEDALTAVLQLGKLAVIRSQMRSEFFDEEDPSNVVASGSAAITFVNDASGNVRRNLRITPRKLQEDTENTGFAVTMYLLSTETTPDAEGFDNTETGGNHTGPIVGGIVGGLAGLALIVVAVVMRRKKKDNDDKTEVVNNLGGRANDL